MFHIGQQVRIKEYFDEFGSQFIGTIVEIDDDPIGPNLIGVYWNDSIVSHFFPEGLEALEAESLLATITLFPKRLLGK